MDLHGWDTVTTLSVESVNRMLAVRPQTPADELSFGGENFGTPYKGSARLGAWRVLPGDPGDLLRLALPIVTGGVAGGSGDVIDLTGTTAVVTVSLHLLPGDVGRPRDLVFDLTRAGRPGDVPVPGVVTPVALTGPAKVLDRLKETGRDIVVGAIAEHLVEHATALSYALAEVNLVAPGQGGRLNPVRSAFCYSRSLAPDDPGHIAVLSVTDGRDVSELPRIVDPELTTGGGEVTFAVSSKLFLTEMVRPGLPGVFGGDASVADLAYDPALRALRNTSTFSTRSLREGAIWYTPRVTSLTVGVVGGELAIRVEGDCDLKAGISMTYWVTGESRMVFDPASARISFVSDHEPRSGYQADVPFWYILGGPVVEGVTQLIVTIISKDLAGRLGSQEGPTGLDRWTSRSVQWRGARTVAVEHAALDGCFLLSGRLA